MTTPVFFQLTKAIPPFEIGDHDGPQDRVEFDLGQPGDDSNYTPEGATGD